MPEHRPGTPEAYVTLESFLWWDFRDASDWAEWAHKRGLAPERDATAAMFAEAQVLQQALRKLEAANNGAAPDPGAVEKLNKLIDKLQLRPRISASGDVALASAQVRNEGPIAALLITALDAMGEGIWNRFKLCRDPTCAASFYDASRNATKVWCSMNLCGSRNKMRRFRERKQS